MLVTEDKHTVWESPILLLYVVWWLLYYVGNIHCFLYEETSSYVYERTVRLWESTSRSFSPMEVFVKFPGSVTFLMMHIKPKKFHKATSSVWASAKTSDSLHHILLVLPVAFWKSFSFPLPVQCFCLRFVQTSLPKHSVFSSLPLCFGDCAITWLQLLLLFCAPLCSTEWLLTNTTMSQ